jgi:hypothetical protein
MLHNPACTSKCRQWSETIAARKYGGADLAARIISGMI